MAGKTEWYIPDMYWPGTDLGEYKSHEAICVLNTSLEDCIVNITLYFSDQEPIECETVVCPAKRTNHIRTDILRTIDGAALPRGIGYAGYVKCSVPAIVQYTRVDTTKQEFSLMTTMCY